MGKIASKFCTSPSSSAAAVPRHRLHVRVFFDDQSDDINGHAVLRLLNDSAEQRLFRLESLARGRCRIEPKCGVMKPAAIHDVNIYFYEVTRLDAS